MGLVMKNDIYHFWYLIIFIKSIINIINEYKLQEFAGV